jgi:DNA repair exonuclease SbcCD nuclease subunit
LIRFVHTADWQLGAPSQLSASQRPLAALVDAAIAEKASFIVCAGDIFHKPHPDQQTKDYLLHAILDTPDIFWVFMAGNHDYTNRNREYTSLRYLSLLSRFKKVPNTYVIEPGRYISFKNAIFWALDEWSDVKNVQAPAEKGKPVIAMWHGIVPGINIKNLAYDPDKQEEDAKALLTSGIDYIALGDIHKQFKIHDRCYYPGALVQTSFVDDLGALLVEVNGKNTTVKSLDLNLPKKISFHVEFEDGKSTEEDIIEFVKSNAKNSNFIKLKFNLPLDVYGAINKKYIEEQVTSYCQGIVFDNDPVIKTRTRKNLDKMTRAATFEDEIDVVLAEERFDLDLAKLKKKILHIVEHAEVES